MATTLLRAAKPSGWSGRLIMVVGGTLIVFGRTLQVERLLWFAALPLIVPTAGMLLIWWLISASPRTAACRRD